MSSNDLLAELKRRGAYVERLDHDVVRLRVSVIADMIHDAHARGIEEAAGIVEAKPGGWWAKDCGGDLRARAEAVRKGDT